MTIDKEGPPAPRGFRWIFVRQFRHAKTGKIIRASDYGHQAFRILVRMRRRPGNRKRR